MGAGFSGTVLRALLRHQAALAYLLALLPLLAAGWALRSRADDLERTPARRTRERPPQAQERPAD